MRVDFVVVVEPFRQLFQNLLGGLQAVDMHIVPLEGVYEPLGHPVALRALDRRRARQQAHAGREHPRFMRRVGGAVVAEPLDPVREMIHQAEPGLDALRHQVTNHLSRDSRRRGDVADDLAIVAVHAERYPNPLAVPAADLEHVGAPPHVAGQRDDQSVVRPHRPSRMLGKQKIVPLHDPVHPLAVHPRTAQLEQAAVQQRRDPRIPVRRATIGNLPDQGQQGVILGLPVPPARCAFPLRVHVRPGDAQGVRDRLHREPSFLSKGIRNRSFFSRAMRIASRRISVSIVFLPRRRSNSRIWALSCFTSEAGTTWSSASTATRAPSRMSLRQWNSWLGLTPYLRATAEREFPGCSASSKMARFSSGAHRRRRWTEVMTSMGPMSGLSLGVVIRLGLLLSLRVSNRSVRSKQGQAHLLHQWLVVVPQL